jgi:release factor glutamine methyltransferase
LPPVSAAGTQRRAALVERLEAAGCVAAEEEADELLEAAAGDPQRLEDLVERREAGEPLAWITGWVEIAGARIAIVPGVYVPRWQTGQLVAVAAGVLRGSDDRTAEERVLAVDLCTGSGAVAAALSRVRPDARVLATDIDATACRCAAANGVEVYQGDMDEPLPAWVGGRADVVVAVVPYVPTDALDYLPRDVLRYEPRRALDGGPGGLTLLERAVRAAARLLRPGGVLLLELGGDQDVALRPVLAASGFGKVRRHEDEEGDVRALEAVLGG